MDYGINKCNSVTSNIAIQLEGRGSQNRASPAGFGPGAASVAISFKLFKSSLPKRLLKPFFKLKNNSLFRVLFICFVKLFLKNFFTVY